MPYPTDSTAPARRPLHLAAWNAARAVAPTLTAVLAISSLLACGTSSSGGVVRGAGVPAHQPQRADAPRPVHCPEQRSNAPRAPAAVPRVVAPFLQ